jgi:tetratricopeptide (TPR) repeat protein
MNLPEEELLRRLSVLKDAELLYERGLFPDSTFVFKHALTREVVYGTLLESKKKDLHIDIGRAIEEVYKDNLEEMYSALAEHFEEGGDCEKAAQYFRLAARKARRTGAYTHALAFSRKGVACLEKLPQTVEVQKRVIDARVTVANNCLFLNHYAEARDAVAPVVELVHQLDYRRRLPAIYVFMAAYLTMVEERYSEAEARRYLVEAQRLAPEEKDYFSLFNAYYHEGLAHAFNCEFAGGESCFLRIMEMSEAAGDVTGLVVAKFNEAYLIHGLSGRIEDALRCSQEALQIALQADDLYMKSGPYWALAWPFQKGLFLEAEENLTLAIELAQKADFAGPLLLCFCYLGLLRSEMGRYREAQECYDGLLAVYERVRIWPSMARFAAIAKVAAGVRGRLNPALDAALNFDLQEIRARIFQGMAAHVMGEIFLHIDDKHMDVAEAWIRKAVEADERNRMPWYLAGLCPLRRILQEEGRSAQAKEKLYKAIELMRVRCRWVGKQV